MSDTEDANRNDGKAGRDPDAESDEVEAEDQVVMAESGEGLRRKEVKIGAVFLVTLTAAVFGLQFLRGTPLFAGEYEIVAHFEEIQGIQQGAPVDLSGVPVGRVTRVALASDTTGVLVHLGIDDEISVPRGSTASVTGVPGLGRAGISIRRGPLDAESLHPGDTLPAGPEAGLMAVAESADTTLDNAAETLREIQAMVSAARGDVSATASNLRMASAGAREILYGERDRLRSTIVTVDELGGRLTELTRELERLSARGGDTLVATMSDVHDVVAQLDTTLVSLQASGASLERILVAVDSGEGTVGRLVHDPALYDRLDTLTLRLNRLVSDFQENPGRYLSTLGLFSLF